MVANVITYRARSVLQDVGKAFGLTQAQVNGLTKYLDTRSPKAIRAEVDALGSLTLVDGQTCDVDTRRSVLFEMSDDEFLDFLLETGILEEALAELEQAFIEGATEAAVNAAIDKIEEKVGEAFAKFVGKVVGKLISKLL